MARRSWLAVSVWLVLAGLAACDKTPVEPTPPPCAFTLSTASLQFAAGGGTASVGVATAAGCNWTASAGAPWLTIAAGSSGTGAGTVTISAAANAETTARSSAVSIAGQTVTVQQEGLEPCTYAITPTTANAGRDGASGAIDVSAAAHCTWTAASTAGWLRVTSGSSGIGPGVVTYAADPNRDPLARTGTLEVAGQTFTLVQAGDTGGCTYRVEPATFAICMAWDADLVSTITTQDGCPWEAGSAAPWMSVVDGQSGVGSGSVRFRGTDNWEAPRTGVVEVRWPTPTAGQNIHVQQAGCTYGLSRNAFSFAIAGGTGAFDVVQQSDPTSCGGPLQNACLWSAESDVPWITVAGSMPRTGDDRVTFTVAANTTGAARTGTIRVRDQVVTIVQAGG